MYIYIYMYLVPSFRSSATENLSWSRGTVAMECARLERGLATEFISYFRE